MSSELYSAGIAIAENSGGHKYFCVQNCENSGAISAKSSVGGIVTLGGVGETASWTITDCKNTGVISTATVVWDEKGIATTQQ